MPDLFLLGDFAQHSGGRSWFRIECDALSDNELKALAAMLASRLPPFGGVHHCGGASHRLALALYNDHLSLSSSRQLLVDDVYTTGATIEKFKHQLKQSNLWSTDGVGAVLFAWSNPPPWVTALFTVAPEYTHA